MPGLETSDLRAGGDLVGQRLRRPFPESTQAREAKTGRSPQKTARPLENLLSTAHCLSALALVISAMSPRV